jgi:hypothetical protein
MEISALLKLNKIKSSKMEISTRLKLNTVVLSNFRKTRSVWYRIGSYHSIGSYLVFFKNLEKMKQRIKLSNLFQKNNKK